MSGPRDHISSFLFPPPPLDPYRVLLERRATRPNHAGSLEHKLLGIDWFLAFLICDLLPRINVLNLGSCIYSTTLLKLCRSSVCLLLRLSMINFAWGLWFISFAMSHFGGLPIFRRRFNPMYLIFGAFYDRYTKLKTWTQLPLFLGSWKLISSFLLTRLGSSDLSVLMTSPDTTRPIHVWVLCERWHFELTRFIWWLSFHQRTYTDSSLEYSSLLLLLLASVVVPLIVLAMSAFPARFSRMRPYPTARLSPSGLSLDGGVVNLGNSRPGLFFCCCCIVSFFTFDCCRMLNVIIH